MHSPSEAARTTLSSPHPTLAEARRVLREPVFGYDISSNSLAATPVLETSGLTLAMTVDACFLHFVKYHMDTGQASLGKLPKGVGRAHGWPPWVPEAITS
jgi:hypothetical protein